MPNEVPAKREGNQPMAEVEIGRPIGIKVRNRTNREPSHQQKGYAVRDDMPNIPFDRRSASKADAVNPIIDLMAQMRSRDRTG